MPVAQVDRAIANRRVIRAQSRTTHVEELVTVKEKRRSGASALLRERYIGNDAERLARLDEEQVSADVAQLIYDVRTDAGLSQRELAALVGTTQSVISRLEDSDYGGRSLTMLERIARALNKRLKITMTDRRHRARTTGSPKRNGRAGAAASAAGPNG